METDYASLAALRASLTSDDPDARGDAYQAVYEADLKPSNVIGTTPSDETVDALLEAGVIPEGSDSGMTESEWKAEVLDRLDAIEAALRGGA